MWDASDWAAKILADEGICQPVLLGNAKKIQKLLDEHEVPADVVEVVDPLDLAGYRF